MNESDRTIDLSGGAPWYAGVGVAEKATEFADAAGDDFDTRLSLYWLYVGTQFREQFPEGTGEEHQLYAQGAALRQPRRPDAIVSVTITSDELSELYGDDLEGMERVLEALFQTIARRIGRDEFIPGKQEQLTTPGGMAVGTFTVNV